MDCLLSIIIHIYLFLREQALRHLVPAELLINPVSGTFPEIAVTVLLLQIIRSIRETMHDVIVKCAGTYQFTLCHILTFPWVIMPGSPELEAPMWTLHVGCITSR